MVWIFSWDETQMISLQTSHRAHCHLDCTTLGLQFSLIDYWPISWQGDLRHRSNEQNVGLWHSYSPSNGHLPSSCQAKRRTLRWRYLRGDDLLSSFTCCGEWHRVIAFYWHIRNRWCCPSFISRNTERHKHWLPRSQKQPTSGWSQVIENKVWHALRDDQSPQRNLEVLWVNLTIITPEEKRQWLFPCFFSKREIDFPVRTSHGPAFLEAGWSLIRQCIGYF